MISKIQYNNCEPGEYKEEKNRTREETIQLIENFPWEEQRKNLKVDLTNPSITLQNDQGDFLKLALYYNGKFVLYFLDRHHKLYTKSLFRYPEAYPDIDAFFGTSDFAPAGFRRQPGMFSYSAPFFDQDFHYNVTRKNLFYYLLSTTGVNFLLSLVAFGAIIYRIFICGDSPAILILLLPLIFLTGGGLNLIVFFNYFRYAKGKLLIASRGNDQFSFGPEDAPTAFDKKQITRVSRYKSRGSKNLFAGFEWVELDLNDGHRLIIPNLLIDSNDLVAKFPGIALNEVRKNFPTISRDAPVPS